MPNVAILVALLALGGVHWLLSRSRWPWLGAVVPVVLLGGLGVLFARGQIDSLVDYAVAALALVALLRIWGEGRQARRARVGAA